jgi:very-short-patch-repair endonuclease
MAPAIRSRTHRARRLRREASDAERLLWRALREMNLPVKVRRQHPTSLRPPKRASRTRVGRYIADFAVPARKLMVELDGGQHASRKEADAERTEALREHGYSVIRFRNDEVLGNPDGVPQRIAAELETPPPHPDPLRPLGGRRGDSR